MSTPDAKPNSPELFVAGAALLLGCMAWAQLTSARLENQTPDESVHLVSGYAILKDGRYSLNAENPPVTKTVSALPLLLLNPMLPEQPEGWEAENDVAISRPFLYQNRIPADTLLAVGRFPMMVVCWLLGLAIAIWVRAHYGDAAGLIALAFFCFDPNFTAHGRYITSDVAAALLYFAAVILCLRAVEHRTWSSYLAASVTLGIAACTKFSLLILLPLWLAADFRQWRRWPVILAVAGLTVWAIYGFEVRTVQSDPVTARFLEISSAELRSSTRLPETVKPLLDPDRWTGRSVRWFAANIPVPAWSFWKGLYRVYNHGYFGHSSYLMGDTGWHWYYFPAAFAVKTPTALLAALAGALFVLRRRMPMLLPAALVYFAATMVSPIQIGHRHLLPVYPLLLAIIGAAAAQSRVFSRVACVLAAGLVLEWALVHPHYLAFFNSPSGGPSNGLRWLADSNLDWGQDLKKFGRYQKSRSEPVCFHYWGAADVYYYDVPAPALRPECSRFAVSATAIATQAEFRHLLACVPEERIGYSIYVFDASRCALRKQDAQHSHQLSAQHDAAARHHHQ